MNEFVFLCSGAPTKRMEERMDTLVQEGGVSSLRQETYAKDRSVTVASNQYRSKITQSQLKRLKSHTNKSSSGNDVNSHSGSNATRRSIYF